MTDEQLPRGGFKLLSILWAVLIGIGLVALGGSILLPSTKRARVNVEEIRRLSQERAAAAEAEAEAAAAAAAATAATATPSTSEASPATQSTKTDD
jgi:hypothetical protein